MDSPILTKSITGDVQITTKACYLVGVELSHDAADTILIIYDEDDGDKTAAKKVVTLRTSVEQQDTSRMFPLPGIKCIGLYADYDAGIGTVYYYY